MNANENDNAGTPSLGLDRSLRIPTQKTESLSSLLRLLDTLIFLQLGVIYLQDNLTLFLLLRAVSQVLHVQFRPPPLTPPAIQVPPVVLINLLCFATHLLQARPEAKGWASRGYLHGGLIVDFVGELGPISKWRLVLMDILILGLQLVMLVVGNEKIKVSGGTEGPEPSDSQDLEAAEEGRVRSRAPHTGTEEGIELQSLLPEGSGESENKSAKTAGDDDTIELDMRQGLKSLLRRSRTAITASTTNNTTDSATIADLLTRIAAARARAA